MRPISIYKENNFTNIKKLKTFNFAKYNVFTLIKLILISLYILFNMALFSIFAFTFTLLYIKTLGFGYILEFKVFAFIYSIICAWIDLVLLLPIIFVPNFLIFCCIEVFFSIKNKLVSFFS